MQNYSLDLRVQYLDMETPALISIMNEIDAKELGVGPEDRIVLKNPLTNEFTVSVVDISKNIIPKGTIGITNSIKKEFNLEGVQKLNVSQSTKPRSFSYISKKIAGKELTKEEMKELVEDIKHNKLSSIELTAFVTAVKINNYTDQETYAMAKYIADSGSKLNLNVDGIIVDKHSIGGINGRATMLVVPIISCFDELYMPKTSSRAITSPAGTADAMEVLADVNLDAKRFKEVVEKTHGAVVWGGAFDFAPVDDKIIKIERPLRIDPQGQVIASVLSKKLCVGAQKVVIDLPVGKEMKVKTIEEAEKVARRFVTVGKELGMDVRGIITNANSPCGDAFGPALEAKYVLETLEGKREDNLAGKACELAGIILEMTNQVEKGKGTKKAKEILHSGKALKKFKQIIAEQGKLIDKSENVVLGQYVYEFLAQNDGYIQELSVFDFTSVALSAGAPFDKGAGVLLNVRPNQSIKKDDVLFRIYANNKDKLNFAVDLANKLKPIKFEEIVLEEIY